MQSDEKLYVKLIDDYHRAWSEVRKAEKKGEESGYIKFLDIERNGIHNELRRVGELIGKDSQDITLDILESERNLSEYDLSEFKVFRTEHALSKISNIKITQSSGEVLKMTLSDDLPENVKAFIPFGKQEFWHLFDYEDYAARHPEELERRRRMHRAIALMKGDAQAIEIHSRETFHRGVTLFGVACSPQRLETLLRTIKEHRTEISIDKKFFDPERVRGDMRQMLQEDLDYILNREPDEHETKTYLVKRLGESLLSNKNFLAEDRKEIEMIIDKARERAERIEEGIQSELDGERAVEGLDIAERLFPKESNKPIRESMRRR